jgi:pyruvate, orthophosphate dikinase
VARRFGAEGIGLCRTEHMFFEGDRILAVREMILANGVEERKRALAKLLPIQREDFVGIFREMNGLPVTIRLLDPPLHEFLPQEPEAQEEMARIFGTTVEVIRKKVSALHEFNPMMGHRGCRLGVTFPEVYDMQTTAIFEAACAVSREGKTVVPEIMIPLVGTVAEFDFFATRIRDIGKTVMSRAGVNVAYLVGTMIEVPRAALQAGPIAKSAEFFSFGTNDLTQMTFGFSRDDSGSFLPAYLELKILPDDPFQTLDQVGVGRLVKLAVDEGRGARPNLKVGICGEHGGDPASVAFCHGAGLNYVSCSPFRVPIARLAAAQAAIQGKAARDAAL